MRDSRRPGSWSAVLQGRRPSTCPALATADGIQGEALRGAVPLGSSRPTTVSGVADGRVRKRVGRQGLGRTIPAATHVAWGVEP